MQPIFYDVAVSVDGFIAGPSDDVSRFPHSGSIVEDYIKRLETYSHCLMGRKTYEFGYEFGLKPGENPYPSMQTTIISSSIDLPTDRDVKVVRVVDVDVIGSIRKNSPGPVYLCGGGELAGWFMRHGLIQGLRLKRAPILLGGGTALFGDSIETTELHLVETKSHGNGAVYSQYSVTN